MRTFLPAIVVCLSIAAQAAARPIYVDNQSGDDHYSGFDATSVGGASGPVRTINKALRLAQKGDRIVLANTGTPYRETIGLCGGDHSGGPLNWFVLEGNGATLDGSAPIAAEAWTPVLTPPDVFRFRPRLMAHQQLFLDGAPLPRVRAAPGAVSVPVLEPLQWCLHEGWIYFRGEPGKWIDQYDLSHAVLTVGITLYHVQYTAVTDLIVQGFQLDGVNAHDVRDCTLHGVTGRGNGRSGLAVAASSRLLIDRCLSGDNGEAQLWLEGESITWIRESELLANTAPQVHRREGARLVVEEQPKPAPSNDTQPNAAP